MVLQVIARKCSAPGIDIAQLGTIHRDRETGWEKLLELAAGADARLPWSPRPIPVLSFSPSARAAFRYRLCFAAIPSGESSRGGWVVVDVVREEHVEGWSDGWERANELLLTGRVFPSKLMCANA